MNIFHYCPCCAGVLARKKIDRKLRLICSKCGFILYQNSKPCVGAIILEGESILLTERAFDPRRGDWDLPGGFLEFAESPEKGLKRELMEELGLRCKVQNMFGAYVDPYGNSGEYTISLYYFVTPAGKIKKVADDVSDYGFFPLKQPPRNLAFPSVKKVLKKLRDKGPGPINDR